MEHGEFFLADYANRLSVALSVIVIQFMGYKLTDKQRNEAVKKLEAIKSNVDSIQTLLTTPRN